ncbi:hypothetical protein [Bordetella sp. BOR01]|uniref:hypothetical protein n=1 Tax=Bordetella sp. BOR01 TaxID=2854779 RepID=UPI001C477107|nr:hypothetical protein [Bordetella sp. BOR01]MBV7484478.1 hypothetical protein [Bordetella sp. BOR01]
MEKISHHEEDIVRQKWKSLFRDKPDFSWGNARPPGKLGSINGKMFPEPRVYTDPGSPDTVGTAGCIQEKYDEPWWPH